MIKMLSFALALFVALATPPLGARAQDNPLLSAQTQGLVGERPDGLVGIVSSSAPASTRTLVERINRERMTVYGQIAQRNGTSVEAVQRSAGQRLVNDTPAGQYFMDAGGKWQRK